MKGNDAKWTEWSEMIIKEWMWKETMGNDGWWKGMGWNESI